MLKIRCKKHPYYGGKISPKAACEPCIELYRIRHLIAPSARLEVVVYQPKEVNADD